MFFTGYEPEETACYPIKEKNIIHIKQVILLRRSNLLESMLIQLACVRRK
jgi:hypothetical protein